MLRYFKEEMRTMPKIHTLIAIPYVRTELQLRFTWCLIGLTRGEYDLEERERSKEEKVLNERTDDPRRSSSSVREAERRSLIRSIHDRAEFSASTEHLC